MDAANSTEKGKERRRSSSFIKTQVAHTLMFTLPESKTEKCYSTPSIISETSESR
jgi:hypothetical protein